MSPHPVGSQHSYCSRTSSFLATTRSLHCPSHHYTARMNSNGPVQSAKRPTSSNEAPVFGILASPIPLPSFVTLSQLQLLPFDVYPIIDTAPQSTNPCSHLLARCQLLAASKRRRLDEIVAPSGETPKTTMNWWKSDSTSATSNAHPRASQGTEEEREGLMEGAQRTMFARPKPVRGIAFSPYNRQPTPASTERSSVLSSLDLAVNSDSSQSSFGDPTGEYPLPSLPVEPVLIDYCSTAEGTPFPTSSATIGDYWTRNNTLEEPLSTTFCAGSFEWVTEYELASTYLHL